MKTLGSLENEQAPPSRPMSSNDVIIIREESQHEKRVNLEQQIKVFFNVLCQGITQLSHPMYMY